MINIPQQPKRQDSLVEQLRELKETANKLGMFDAADFIQNLVDSKMSKLNSFKKRKYDSTFGDDKLCVCGHKYDSHFDTDEDINNQISLRLKNLAEGFTGTITYLGCYTFKESEKWK